MELPGENMSVLYFARNLNRTCCPYLKLYASNPGPVSAGMGPYHPSILGTQGCPEHRGNMPAKHCEGTKKPKKPSQGGPKHCEGTKKNQKNQFSRPHGNQSVTTEEAGFHETWKIGFFSFFGTLTVFWASLNWFFGFF